MTDETRCRMVEIDGEMVRLQGAKNLTDEDMAALTEVVRAAKAKMASEPPGPLTVACPVCNVGAGAFCRNREGRVTGVHRERRAAVSS